MNFYDLNEAAKQPQTMAALAGLLNPATILPAIAIGAVGIAAITAIKALKNRSNSEDDSILEVEYEDEKDYEPYYEPLSEPLPTVESNGSNTVENMSDEELQKEMIRQTMSELGKRSAAARRAKKDI
ncbi:MAG: hypothetical protein QF692_01150 [Alphaproteobacteria bacterium]|jgi:hypothetical protein|nr:hypothetical protein [Alphaproteobacteria bacterium]MDP7221849.1 hypothetical protein [Alphaproteobacteria bacterium]